MNKFLQNEALTSRKLNVNELKLELPAFDDHVTLADLWDELDSINILLKLQVLRQLPATIVEILLNGVSQLAVIEALKQFDEEEVVYLLSYFSNQGMTRSLKKVQSCITAAQRNVFTRAMVETRQCEPEVSTFLYRVISYSIAEQSVSMAQLSEYLDKTV